MATRRRIFDYSCFNANHNVADGLFSLMTTVVNNEIKLSVIKLHSKNSEHVDVNKEPIFVSNAETMELNKELFDLVINQQGEDRVASTMDPFIRWKFRNSIIYKLLYYCDTLAPRNGTSHVSQLLWCLYENDVDVLEYLVYLFGGMEIKLDLFLSACLRMPKCKNGSSPRHRLGFSKNKARVIKACRYPEIMKFPNYVFDDDVDFLLELMKIRNTYSAIRILEIKEANPKLTYEDIVRKATIFTIDAQNEYMSLSSAIDVFAELLECYKSLQDVGFDRPFKLCSRSIVYGKGYGANADRPITFKVEDATVYPLNNANQLAYANAISEAFSKDGLDQALSRGNEFCLIVKKGRYYIVEVHDGYVININSKHDISGLQVIY